MVVSIFVNLFYGDDVQSALRQSTFDKSTLCTICQRSTWKNAIRTEKTKQSGKQQAIVKILIFGQFSI